MSRGAAPEQRKIMPSHCILAATDFSRTAQLAVRRAAQLAEVTDARMDVVHVARPTSRSLLSWLRDEPSAAALEAARRQLDETVADIGERGVSARGHLVTGAPVATIEATSRALRTSLVALGTRGAVGLRERLLGTTGERLIERSPCDVLVVRGAVRAAYRTILACVDGSPAAGQALRRAVELTPAAEVHVLHVHEPPLAAVFRGARLHGAVVDHLTAEQRRAHEALAAFIDDLGLGPRSLSISVKTGYPPHVIERTALRVLPDLIAVGHHTSPLARPFLGSVARYVLRLDVCDVLVARR
jgi:universal stress protein E